MSFWEDLSPAVKRYVMAAVALVLVLLALRTCAGPETAAPPPPRAVSQ